MRPSTFEPLLARLLAGCISVLDLGCGPMETLSRFGCRVKVGVDAHMPYLERRPDDPALVPLLLDLRSAPQVFPPSSFDAITMIDSIEHLERSDGERLLDELPAIARRRVIVFTPRGEFPQHGFDAYGLGGERYQEHRSSWEVHDFTERDYACAVLSGFHGPANRSFVEAFGEGAEPRDALIAWKNC